LIGLLFIFLAETDSEGSHSLKDSISSVLKGQLPKDEKIEKKTRLK